MAYAKLTTLVIVLILTAGSASLAVGSAEAQDLPGELYSLSGTVENVEAGALEGAQVALRPASGGESRSVPTDATGAYEFTGLAAGTYNVSVSHACCTTGFAQVRVGGTTLEHAQDFQLEPQPEPQSGQSVLLNGTVFDRDTDETIANANIQISNYYDAAAGTGDNATKAGAPERIRDGGYQWFNVVSGEDGTWSINVNPGTVELWVEHGDYDYTRGTFDVAEPTQIDVPMRPTGDGGVVLHGVLRSTDGTPLEGWVSVSPDYASRCDGDVCYAYAEPAGTSSEYEDGFWFEPRGDRYGHAETDADGRWTIQTFPGALRVYAYVHYDGQQEYLPAEKRIQAEEGDNQTVDLELTPIPADSVKVTGKVVDNTDGTPIPQATVSAQNQKWGTYNSTQTADDGTFTIWVKSGYVILEFRAWERYWVPCEASTTAAQDEPASGGGTSGSSGASMIVPEPYCEPRERDHAYFPKVVAFSAAEGDAKQVDADLIRFPKPDATFTGWVVNASSQKGVEGATVTFYNERTRDWGQAVTDANGSYKIEVHAGYYTVRAYADGYFDGVLNDEIEAGATQKLNVVLEPGQKRWGYYCCYGYGAPMAAEAGADQAARSGGFQGEARDADAGSSTPDGAQMYHGESGGLGPYDPAADLDQAGGGAPGFGPLVAALAALAALVLIRRRRD